MTGIPFIKMHGAGNDFVILDERTHPYALTSEEIRRICDRRLGIGCDQLIALRLTDLADVHMSIYNADGGEVGACGNATRCVGWLMSEEMGKDTISIETSEDMLECTRAGDLQIKVSMGAPKFDWRAIPLSKEEDTMRLPVMLGDYTDPVAVNMGNPHAVYFGKDIINFELEKYGPTVENNSLFPERVNVEIAEVKNRKTIDLRVWERGVGETAACGTGACATMVAARLLDKVDDVVDVHLPGGVLRVEWHGSRDNPQPVYMTGPVAYVAKGEWVR